MPAATDPWDGRTLEWMPPSPPPPFNFAVLLPAVTGLDAYWEIKRDARDHNRANTPPPDTAIEMPRNSPTGFVTAFFAVVTGFALIWTIWWMVAIGVAGAFTACM